MEINKFLLGVNYWPAKKAMYWWKNFDTKEVEDDFKLIKELGLDLVRIFLVWEDFQPYPDYVSQSALRKLAQVCDIAAENQLRLIITFFTGHMSGVNWIPEWALDKHTTIPKGIRYYPTITNLQINSYQIKDMYSDDFMLKAQKLQVKSVVKKLCNHAALWGWDISNEISNLCVPKTVDLLQKWIVLLTKEIRKLDTSHPIILGTHVEDLEIDTKFYPWIVGGVCDYLVVHGYSAYSKWVRTPLDSAMLPFLCILTESIGGKPIIVEEFGAPTLSGDSEKTIKDSQVYLATEDEQAWYFKETLQKIHNAGSIGALVWCFADYHKSLWRKPPLDKKPHERFFGVTRSNGTLKPAARVLKEFASKKLKVKAQSRKLRVSKKTYYSKPLENIAKYYQRYLRKFVLDL